MPELLPLLLFTNKKFQELDVRSRNVLIYMRYHCIATDNYKGILEFPHKLAVEYGLFPTSNTRDLYKCIDNLVDAGFVEKLGSGRYKKTIYRIVDFNKTKVASVKSPHESKVKPLPYIEREVVNG